MIKNGSGQKFIVFAFDATTGLPKTGDSANITVYLGKDNASPVQTTDTSATEISSTNASGYYMVDAAQAETNYNAIHLTGKSSTSNIVVIGVPAMIYPTPDPDVAPAIKVQTDKFVFTVANEVNANTRYIKGQAISGSGSSVDPWHP